MHEATADQVEPGPVSWPWSCRLQCSANPGAAGAAAALTPRPAHTENSVRVEDPDCQQRHRYTRAESDLGVAADNVGFARGAALVVQRPEHVHNVDLVAAQDKGHQHRSLTQGRLVQGDRIPKERRHGLVGSLPGQANANNLQRHVSAKKEVKGADSGTGAVANGSPHAPHSNSSRSNPSSRQI